MPTFLVYQKITSGHNPINPRYEEAPSVFVNIETDYRLMASVSAYTADEVWDMCNTKPWDEKPWHQNSGVRLALAFPVEEAYSLSKGDLVYNCRTGALLEVAGSGWKTKEAVRC